MYHSKCRSTAQMTAKHCRFCKMVLRNMTLYKYSSSGPDFKDLPSTAVKGRHTDCIDCSKGKKTQIRVMATHFLQYPSAQEFQYSTGTATRDFFFCAEHRSILFLLYLPFYWRTFLVQPIKRLWWARGRVISSPTFAVCDCQCSCWRLALLGKSNRVSSHFCLGLAISFFLEYEWDWFWTHGARVFLPVLILPLFHASRCHVFILSFP